VTERTLPIFYQQNKEERILSNVITIKQQIDDLQKQLDAAIKVERIAVIAKLLETMKTYNITVRDLTKKRPLVRASKAVAPKYRNADTGATWSGRGKAPRWFDKSDSGRFAIPPDQ